MADATGTEEEVIDYLVSRGQLSRADGQSARVRRLTGGVSAETLLVESPAARLVVKRALGKLLVPGDWTAKPGRAMTEAAAIEALHAITPEHVPVLLDADPDRNTIVMLAAPDSWVNWKTVLLGEAADPSAGIAEVAGVLGQVLGTWHLSTRDDKALASRFADYEAFEQLRVAPFYREIAVRHPRIARHVGTCVAELEDRRDCLVHGDYSPKNVLVGPDSLLVLDFEVAHTGAAVFDLAFMLHHLMLKAMHRPGHRRTLADAGVAFLAAYRQTTSDDTDPLLGSHVACLLLARVDGLSPASYLSPQTADEVRGLATRLLSGPEPAIEDIWSQLREGTAS
jgi:5-methylthioribose kinase